MKVLVTAASKHGATWEIAEAIRDTLVHRGIQATLLPLDQADDVASFDAVVLGSAVYTGRWLAPAREFARRHRAQLTQRPVWIFSSGPLGDPPRPLEDPSDVAELREQLRVREHRLFPGKLDRSRLSFGDRVVAVALHAPNGDFRDFEAVRAWAGEIASALLASEGAVP